MEARARTPAGQPGWLWRHKAAARLLRVLVAWVIRYEGIKAVAPCDTEGADTMVHVDGAVLLQHRLAACVVRRRCAAERD